MKHWYFLVGLLWISCTVLVTASVNVGRLEPSSDPFSAVQITDCNKVPCVQGVIPGVTTWDYVTAHFARDAGSSMTNSIVVGADTLVHTTFTSDAQGQTVDAISVILVAPNITLGSLITRYGTPCKLRVYASGGIQVIYPQVTAALDISLSSDDTTLSAETAVRELDFSAEPNSCEFETSTPDNMYHDKNWRGFLELDKYYQN